MRWYFSYTGKSVSKSKCISKMEPKLQNCQQFVNISGKKNVLPWLDFIHWLDVTPPEYSLEKENQLVASEDQLLSPAQLGEKLRWVHWSILLQNLRLPDNIEGDYGPLRWQLYRQQGKKAITEKLPPVRNSLFPAIHRAAFVSQIAQKAADADIELDRLSEHCGTTRFGKAVPDEVSRLETKTINSDIRNIVHLLLSFRLSMLFLATATQTKMENFARETVDVKA